VGGEPPVGKTLMYELTVLSHFSAAHRLRSLHGRCEGLHGHNWKIEVCVTSGRLGKEGVVIDFGVLKEQLAQTLKELDHTYLNDLSYFAKREPSSENIAKFIYEGLRTGLKGQPARIKSVTAWESETACATYLGSKR
jgi:6-pyruvoyltetrahydropterin/6-carboxytetrahydropterin synthase